ncbi:hypothetical protein WMY93_010372 [Mugilogobius chulae]|uniref:DDE Tnp4 domain-containing protein n=1 Tax=Mugilogobius chulae TaxID=88201 RepID=A0AAW0P7C3_9GOBI
MADRGYVQRLAAIYLFWRTLQRRRLVQRRRRRFWVHPILQNRLQYGEFHHLIQELRLDDDRFQRYFRLSRAQFDDLLGRIGARITRQDTNYRRSIPPAERLSICLRFLATGDSYCTIAYSFRVGISTVQAIVLEVVTAIWDCLCGEFMAVPTAEDWRAIALEFEERWNFPLCCGAVDGKHVQLIAPPNSGSRFYNYQGDFSIVLMAVIDARYQFRVIDVGGYGRTSDGGIFAHSPFGHALHTGTLQLPPDQHLPGAHHFGPQPHVFVADEAFPLLPHLMRPFSRRPLSLEERVFNYRLSRARLVVEDTFGILTSQWRVYRRLIGLRPEVVERCVKATCILHNFMRPTPQDVPPAVGPLLQGLDPVADQLIPDEAGDVRDTFKAYFSAEGAVAWQPAE